ncbi:hypothetical protein Y032_0713g1748 [Ancylostoma ceylanicum]|nr:hypothetical protein Y032_0713g1748 [Ancylostoma ceylanicum]
MRTRVGNKSMNMRTNERWFKGSTHGNPHFRVPTLSSLLHRGPVSCPFYHSLARANWYPGVSSTTWPRRTHPPGIAAFPILWAIAEPSAIGNPYSVVSITAWPRGTQPLSLDEYFAHYWAMADTYPTAGTVSWRFHGGPHR